MSLINDMLRDLEQRRGGQPTTGIDALGGVAVTAPSPVAGGNPARAMLLGLAAGLAIAALAWLVIDGRVGSASVATGHSEAAEPAPAATPGLKPAAETDAVERADSEPVGPPSTPAKRDTAVATILAEPGASDRAGPANEDANPTMPAAEPNAEPLAPVRLEADIAPPLAESPMMAPAPAVTTRGTVQRERSTAPPGPAEELAALLVRLRDDDATAVAELAALIERHPRASNARALYVREILRRGEREQAEASLRAGLALDPGDGALAHLLAHLLVARGETSAAIAVLEQATPNATDRAEYFALAAALYQREGRHAAAVDAYRAALGDAPGRGAWWVGLAISLTALDDRAGANSAFQRALIDRDLSDRLRSFANRELGRLETKG